MSVCQAPTPIRRGHHDLQTFDGMQPVFAGPHTIERVEPRRIPRMNDARSSQFRRLTSIGSVMAGFLICRDEPSPYVTFNGHLGRQEDCARPFSRAAGLWICRADTCPNAEDSSAALSRTPL